MKESNLWLLSGVLFAIPLISGLSNEDFSEFRLLKDGLLHSLQAIVTVGCFYYYFKKRKEEQKNG